MRSYKVIFIIAFTLLITGVILGALGAHSISNLKGITPKQIDSWKTGVFYQLFNSLGLLLLVLLSLKINYESKLSFYFIIIGVILFSFSIYLLVLTYAGIAPSLRIVFGPITPIGGMLMIVGWTIYAVNFIKKLG